MNQTLATAGHDPLGLMTGSISLTANSSELHDTWWNATALRALERAGQEAGHALVLFQDDATDLDLPDEPLDICRDICQRFDYELVSSWCSANASTRTTTEAIFKCGATDVAIICIGAYSGIRVWSKTAERAQKISGRILDALPKKSLIKDEAITPFAFWRYGSRGPVYAMRDLSCPSWDELRGNYSSEVQSQFDHLLSLERPDEVGKIILWHGLPGTGKTHLVRALARAWSTKLDATVEFVLDYQEMFEHADYMYSVLLDDEQHTRMAARARKRRRDSRKEQDRDSTPLRIIVIEDGADLFSVNCRHKTGFSRFLNASDGIVGQGLRLVFLLTANESIDAIDPAVRRAGRCLQEVKFEPFSVAEANEWLSRRDSNLTVGAPTGLADLYAMIAGRETVGQRGSVGFGF